ncbi:MAG: TonB-dependent receptor [Flavobacteriales bacterium]|nr:TonB-dependent receptor [Flavobacteriales bacterium]
MDAARAAEIRGTVSDSHGVLAFAHVLLSPGEHGATTDAEGNFILTEIPAGEYTLQVSFVGYQKYERTISLTTSEVKDIDIELSPRIDLEEVVVTGNLRPTYVSMSPIKVEVMTKEHLSMNLPSASSSVLQSISLINGVQEVLACGVCYTSSISINGLDGAYTAVLVDGMPMFGNLASVYGLNGIPNSMVERIEVIKGPNSTLYGSEAMAGVINVITKKHEGMPLLSVDMMGTDHGEAFSNVTLSPRIGKSKGYVGLNHAYINDFHDENGDGFGDVINMDRYILFSKWDIHRNSGRRFDIAAKYYYEDRRNGVEEYMVDRGYRDLRGDDQIYGESIYTQRWELFGSYGLLDDNRLRLDFSFSDHDQDSYYGSDQYLAQQRIGFANLIWNRSEGHHHLTSGLTTRYQYYDDNTMATRTLDDTGVIINAPQSQFIPGVFLQDEWNLNADWSLLSGLRLDHYSQHGFITSPRLNLKYRPSDWTTIRLNGGTGFRVVNLFTEDHAFISGQREVVITETLDPERSMSVSLDISHVYSLGEGSGTIGLDAYFTHFSNKILPDYSENDKIIYANSTGYARSMGINGSIDYRFYKGPALKLSANVQEVYEVEEIQGESLRSAVEFAADWSGQVTVNYRWPKPALDMAYTSNIRGPMTLPEIYDLDTEGQPVGEPRNTRSPVFATHNIQLTRTWGAFTVYSGVQNLMDYTQGISPLSGYNDPNAPIGFSEYFDTSYFYSPLEGREFYLGLRWNTRGR